MARAAALAAVVAAGAGSGTIGVLDTPGAWVGTPGTPTPAPATAAKWACGSKGKCVVSNVGHISEPTCKRTCKSPPKGMHYLCGGYGQCFQSKSSNTSLSRCEDECVPPTPTTAPATQRWACGGKGVCVMADIGHSSEASCRPTCTAPPPGMRFNCGGFRSCYQKTDGNHTTLAQCDSACNPVPATPAPKTPSPPLPAGGRWACGAVGKCVVANVGHRSMAKCLSSCKPAEKYMRFNCGGFGHCYQKPDDGRFPAEADCEMSCAPPPPAPTPPPTPLPPGAGWACGVEGLCIPASMGEAGRDECDASCSWPNSTTQFSCGGFGYCYQNSRGRFATPEACDRVCSSAPPPPPELAPEDT